MLHAEGRTGLERLCDANDVGRIATAPPASGIERIEARFFGNLFTPHRHDTYALGVTCHGVQTFNYRGSRRFSTPGNIIILHPDEVHDGGAGTEKGLRYRMLYLDPSLLRRGLDRGRISLPFVKDPVIQDEQLLAILSSALGPLDEPLDALLVDDLVSALAACLSRHAGQPLHMLRSVAVEDCRRAREYLIENATRPVRSDELENVTGLDRFELSRHFRALFATTPHRFLLMRRLEIARGMIAARKPLAEVAVETGFADQSHLTRHFKNAFGVTPGKWVALTKDQQTSS